MSLEIAGLSVRFADPVALWLLLVVILLAFLRTRRERARGGGLLFSAVSILPGRGPSWRTRLRPALAVLRVAALALMVVALARPQVIRASEIPAEGIDIVAVIDLSGSMNQQGLGSGTKLASVKRVLGDFIGGLTNDRIGLTIFGSDALLLSPLTLDHKAAQKMVEPLEAGRFVGGATAIGTGLATGLNALRGSTAPSKVEILLTDGENNVNDILPADASKAAKLLGVRIYTIGAVTAAERSGGTIPVDEALMREISETTGGKYFRVEDEFALRQIYDEIAQLERARVGARTEFASYEDVMGPLLLFATILLLAEVLAGLSILRRTP